MNKNQIITIIVLVLIVVVLFFREQSQKLSRQSDEMTEGMVIEEDEEILQEEPEDETTNEATQANEGGDSMQFKSAPKMEIDENKDYSVVLKTSEGDITIDMHTDETPITVNNFVFLAKKGFYNNTIFHRVIDGFMIQGGDPTGTGTGSPGYRFEDEDFEGEYTRGTVAMANSGPNTNGSQFFIMHDDTPLPPNYVIFGHVVEGLEAVDKIATAKVTSSGSGENSKPVKPAKIISATVEER